MPNPLRARKGTGMPVSAKMVLVGHCNQLPQHVATILQILESGANSVAPLTFVIFQRLQAAFLQPGLYLGRGLESDGQPERSSGAGTARNCVSFRQACMKCSDRRRTLSGHWLPTVERSESLFLLRLLGEIEALRVVLDVDQPSLNVVDHGTTRYLI
jgi:hypothetical protein